MNNEELEKLKRKACDYMDSLSHVRNADFNAGQAMGIKLMFEWISELKNDNQ